MASGPISTTYGPVEGVNRSYNNNRDIVTQYLGIPYAAPPTGDLRFRRPQPHTGWNDTLQATKYGPSCMQYIYANDAWLLSNRNISEDCLQLNIFVPRQNGVTTLRAVMVWIHGGGFTNGQATLFDASYIALEGNVIIVTINYRLGIFGFLTTNDENASGNYGLWDQRYAIQWVKSNIENFGGDSKNICIFGESAGGFSVGFQSMSPLNAGLFQRSIFESGSIPWTNDLAVRTASVAFKLGHEVNCTDVNSHGNTDTRRLIDCLRRVPASVLLAKQNPAASNKEGEFSLLNKLGPVVDGEFVVGDPMTLLKNRSSPVYQTFTNLDIMAGTNNAEGGLVYFNLKNYQEYFHFNITEGIPVDVLCDLVAPSIARDYFNNNTKVSSAICEHYKTNTSSLFEQARSTVAAFADVAFHALTTMMLEIHSNLFVEEGGKTYQYLFSHQPAYPWIRERPGWLLGANHAGELPFVFGLHAMNPPDANNPADEMVLSSKVMKYWTNFAKYG